MRAGCAMKRGKKKTGKKSMIRFVFSKNNKKRKTYSSAASVAACIASTVSSAPGIKGSGTGIGKPEREAFAPPTCPPPSPWLSFFVLSLSASSAPSRSTALLRTPKPNAVMTSMAVAAAKSSTLTETEAAAAAAPSFSEGEDFDFSSQARARASAAASADGRIAPSKPAFIAACENAGATALRTHFHSREAVAWDRIVFRPRGSEMRLRPK